MKSGILFLIVAFLLCPVALKAQARSSTCQVRPLWVGAGVRSANLGSIGSFQADGNEGRTVRSFNFDGTKLIARVGIDYVFSYSKFPKKATPHQIRLAINVSNKKEEEIFESAESAEASTLYGKKWNLTVSKNINFDGRV